MTVRVRDVVSNPLERSGMTTLPYVALENVKAGAGRLMPDTELEELMRSDTVVARSGDVLFGKLRPYLCKVLHVPDDIQCSTELLVMRANERFIDDRFLYYLALSKPFVEWAVATSVGVKMPRTDWAKLSQLELPNLPSIEQQHNIVAHLDSECQRLDTLILEQEHLRQLLIERFTGLIAHTVTKGLAPHVPMQETGVEWIASVPRHWQVMRMKDLGNAIVGLTYSPDDLVTDPDEGTLVLRANNIQKDKFDLSDNVYVRSEIPPQLRHRTGDLLICSRNGSARLIGKCALVPAELAGVTWGVFMTTFRSPRNRYLLWVLRSSLFTQQLGAFATSTINQLTRSTLMDFKVAVPPVDEQDLICEYLENEECTVDALLLALDEMTRLVRERQQAIIAAAVTGKMEVA